MTAATIYEIIGYAASALVVVSLMMSSLLRLRIINLVGAVLFVVYGVLIDALPIVITNGVIAAIDVYYLIKAFRDKAYFTLLEVDPGSRYVAEFLRFYGDDIAKFQPEFSGVELGDLVVLVLRDMVPAGIFVGRPDASGNLTAKLDYAVPGYRDFKLGRHLYGPGRDWFTAHQIRRITAAATTDAHRRYLERMGFHPLPRSDAATADATYERAV